MFSFKAKIKADDLGKALYQLTTNPTFLEDFVNKLNKDNSLDNDKIRNELIILTIFITDILLHSKKIGKSYRNHIDEVLYHYLSNFKSQTEKEGTSEKFIDLLEERSKTYNNLIQSDNISENVHFPSKIAEEIAKYCGAENQPIFIMRVMGFWKIQFDTVSDLFNKLKIV